jgi:hypothetical protein
MLITTASRVPLLLYVAHLDVVAQDGPGRRLHGLMQYQLFGVVRGRASLEDEAVTLTHDAKAADSSAQPSQNVHLQSCHFFGTDVLPGSHPVVDFHG